MTKIVVTMNNLKAMLPEDPLYGWFRNCSIFLKCTSNPKIKSFVTLFIGFLKIVLSLVRSSFERHRFFIDGLTRITVKEVI